MSEPGAGAIALAIADECPEARVTATDVSPDALALARENAERLELAVEFVADRSARQGIDGPFDLVVSNPPYVDAAEIDSLEPEVRDWEPRLALVADGQTERLAREARDLLAPGGCDRPRVPRRACRGSPGAARRARIRRRYDLHGSRRKGKGGRGAMDAEGVAAAVGAIRAGKAVILPADGVYGLCASAFREGPVRHLYELKGRGGAQPTAMMASSVEMLLECVPEFRGRSSVIVRALLPGPYTLVLANPARRYPWLTGTSPETIGVRVAVLPREVQYVLDAVGAIAATSANNPGEPSACDARRRAGRHPCGLRRGARRGPALGSSLDRDRLHRPEPRVLREGAGPVDEALERVDDALFAARVA